MGLTYYWPNISGLTQYAVILAEELQKRNYKVTVIGGRFRKSLKSEEIINGVGVKRVAGFRLGKGFLMPLFAQASLREVIKNEAIICHLPAIESSFLAFWGKVLKKKIIVVHHCEFRWEGNWTNKVTSILTFLDHLVTYFLANKIVAYTKDYADSSWFLRTFRKKLVYILPPIKIEKNKKKINLGKGKVVGFVGRIGWEKGLSYLVEAMKKVRASLVLVGPYQGVAGDKTYEQIRQELNNKTTLYGPMDHQDLKAFYQRCDCLALPSTNTLETFGIVQAEAMVCGCPVVASNLPGVRVPVQMTGMGEICRAADSGDLAKKIRLVLKRGKTYYQKRAKNLDKFDYQKTVNEFEQILAPGDGRRQ
jgi:glycosyltransferase involved in cell wall biosynthesis